MSEQKPVALTGATGFVGRAVLAEIHAAGRPSRILVRAPAASEHKHTEVVKGDLSDRAALRSLAEGCDTVLHIAGAVKAKSRGDFWAINVDGTRNALEEAERAGASRFVFVSSLAARQPELSDYAASKAAGERIVLDHKSSMQTLILRPSAVYGPGDTATLPLLKALMSPIAVVPGCKSCRFSLVHVQDLARVCLAAADSSVTGLLEIDDTSGGYGWSDLAAVTHELSGKPRRMAYLPRALATTIASLGALASLITRKPAMLSHGKVNELYHPDWTVMGAGWPRHNPVLLSKGLAQTISWYQDQGLLPRRQMNPSHQQQSAPHS